MQIAAKPEARSSSYSQAVSAYADTKPKNTPTWFALNDDRPFFAFAGIWRPWMGVRGTKAEHRLFSFLTCDANGIVGPVHPTAMPVPLTTREEWRTWLEALTEIALELQRPWPDSMMKVVATGARRDPAE